MPVPIKHITTRRFLLGGLCNASECGPADCSNCSYDYKDKGDNTITNKELWEAFNNVLDYRP